MPYLKMKTKVSTGCLREKKDFHVCQKSNIISKRSCSSVRISDQVAELDTSIQIVSSSIQVSSKDIASSESVDDKQLLDEGNSQSQHLPSFSVDPDMGKMESRNTCSSNLETIFSPVFEPFKVRSEPNDGNDAVGSVSHTDKLHLGADDSNDNRSFCGYETCDISDFYISDMIVSSLPFNENAFDDDNAENNCSLDYGSGEPNMLFDVADHYLILPSFEETVKTSNTPNVQSHEETITVPDNTSLYSAIGQLRSSNQESDIKYDLDQAECFDPLLFIKNLPELSDAGSKLSSHCPAKRKSKKKFSNPSS
ncbi:CTD small phosphatase-like protein 2 [Quillaja saponaria]|uniref:CTD small phosphatase-like protein 2 n=1 Tax=Quillaja saponaria TaxID=32244 RepID=A0AAD7M2N9_QUISA|nr:CTD small phosphatase-like protein 2 [Quillaja saponaria]